jgi:hypothetical protein
LNEDPIDTHQAWARQQLHENLHNALLDSKRVTPYTSLGLSIRDPHARAHRLDAQLGATTSELAVLRNKMENALSNTPLGVRMNLVACTSAFTAGVEVFLAHKHAFEEACKVAVLAGKTAETHRCRTCVRGVSPRACCWCNPSACGDYLCKGTYSLIDLKGAQGRWLVRLPYFARMRGLTGLQDGALQFFGTTVRHLLRKIQCAWERNPLADYYLSNKNPRFDECFTPARKKVDQDVQQWLQVGLKSVPQYPPRRYVYSDSDDESVSGDSNDSSDDSSDSDDDSSVDSTSQGTAAAAAAPTKKKKVPVPGRPPHTIGTCVQWSDRERGTEKVKRFRHWEWTLRQYTCNYHAFATTIQRAFRRTSHRRILKAIVETSGVSTDVSSSIICGMMGTCPKGNAYYFDNQGLALYPIPFPVNTRVRIDQSMEDPEVQCNDIGVIAGWNNDGSALVVNVTQGATIQTLFPNQLEEIHDTGTSTTAASSSSAAAAASSSSSSAAAAK